jgi:hypothetical protein
VWLRAAAKMASVVTLIIEKTMKKNFFKKISDLPTLGVFVLGLSARIHFSCRMDFFLFLKNHYFRQPV